MFMYGFDDVFVGIFLALLLGALLGAQREIRQQKLKKIDFAGFRTFTFICLFGFLVGFLSFEVLDSIEVFLVCLSGIFLLFVLSYYTISRVNKKQVGVMSQILGVICFVIGVLVSLQFYRLSIALSIVITTILFLGHKLHKFAKDLTQKEIFATLKFAIVALIVLPILPNKNYSPLDFPLLGEFFLKQSFISQEFLGGLDVFNFYHLWLMVVFVSGIAYIGYILMKTVGAKKGILVTGFLGGLMSSTALTSSFSIESRKYKAFSSPLAIGVVIACSTMFFRIVFEVLVLNSDLVMGIIASLGLMGICGFMFAFYMLVFGDDSGRNIGGFESESPFSLGPALKFAGLFLGISFFSKFFTLIFGNSGIYILSFISGITDVDAITISLSTLALNGGIANGTAQIGIIIAALSNTLFKGGIAYYLGSGEFFKKILKVFICILIVGIASLIFL